MKKRIFSQKVQHKWLSEKSIDFLSDWINVALSKSIFDPFFIEDFQCDPDEILVRMYNGIEDISTKRKIESALVLCLRNTYNIFDDKKYLVNILYVVGALKITNIEEELYRIYLRILDLNLRDEKFGNKRIIDIFLRAIVGLNLNGKFITSIFEKEILNYDTAPRSYRGLWQIDPENGIKYLPYLIRAYKESGYSIPVEDSLNRLFKKGPGNEILLKNGIEYLVKELREDFSIFFSIAQNLGYIVCDDPPSVYRLSSFDIYKSDILYNSLKSFIKRAG